MSTPVAGAQIGLASSWIQPNNSGNPVSQGYDCNKVAPLVQSIEGGLGWWGNTPYRERMPKYEPGPTLNCYGTGQREFWAARPIPQSSSGWITLTNRILLPPDGMTFQYSTAAPQLGQAWFSLHLPATGSQAHLPSGNNAWTLFLNGANFAGPIAYVAPQSWASSVVGHPQFNKMTFDARPATAYNLQSEWAMIPFDQVTTPTGTFTRMPDLQFPVDAQGRTILGRDFTTYSDAALTAPLTTAITAQRDLPRHVDASGVALQNQFYDTQLPSGPLYQAGKKLDGLTNNLQMLDQGTAVGWTWPGATRGTMVHWPSYYKVSGATAVAVAPSAAPSNLRAVNFSPTAADHNFTYQSPTWFNSAPASSPNSVTYLNDGSEVIYRWYKFVDQPMVQRFHWTAAEKATMQALVIKMQTQWANDALIDPPTGGSLAGFDPGILVTPPKGLGLGYVPIPITQLSSPLATAPLWISGRLAGGRATVNWRVPEFPGSSPITGYQLQTLTKGHRSAWIPTGKVTSSTTPASSGTVIFVRAVTAKGTGLVASTTV